MSEVTPEQAEQVIVLLLASATAAEAPKITNAGIRAGLMWRCSVCKQPNYPTRQMCSDCRTPRHGEAPHECG